MTNEELKGHIWKNTASNYLSIVLRMALGLFMFRLLYQSMPKEEFGFWSLLWSVFGFGLLLDFGFGFTAVKKVAELSIQEKWEELSRVLSTIFFCYTALALLIIAGALLFSHQLILAFHITPQNHEPFRRVMVCFLIGMAVTFPLGIFPEILMGRQRIFLANVIFSITSISNFIATWIAVHRGWGLFWLTIIAQLAAISPCLLCAASVRVILPKVRIRPRYFSTQMIGQTMSFSIYAYVSTVSNLLLAKTDQLVISGLLSVASVAIYQAGSKIGEMFGYFTQQLPDTFSPAAAHLNASGDRVFLRKLLVDGTRFSVMIATPAYFISACYLEPLLHLLTGDKTPSVETYWVGQTLLLWQYTTILTQSVTKRIFMMCGHEKKLTALGLGEALLNLILSITLVMHYKSVLGVALGSLISTSIFGWFFIWPWAARDAQISAWTLTRIVLFPSWLACIPAIAAVLLLRSLPWIDLRPNLFSLVTQAGFAGAAALIGIWYWALNGGEREKVMLKMGKILNRGRTA